MILVVDGYNVLKRLLAHTHITEGERAQFVREVQGYAKRKKHTVIIVFDGGHTSWASHDKQGKVTVVYAGTQETADDYIMRYLEAHANKDIMLVSSDHELCKAAEEEGVGSLDSHEFYSLLKQAFEEQPSGVSSSGGDVQKLSAENSHDLDAVMEQESVVVPHKGEDTPRSSERVSPGKKLSKRERAMMKKLKKL